MTPEEIKEAEKLIETPITEETVDDLVEPVLPEDEHEPEVGQ